MSKPVDQLYILIKCYNLAFEVLGCSPSQTIWQVSYWRFFWWKETQTHATSAK